MAEVEVTWDQYWAFYGQTMSEGRTPPETVYANNSNPDVDAISGPTPPFGFPDQGWGAGDRPAITMTHYAAETFCQWLSKQTGKKYGIDVAPTCDAKYLEVGVTSKSDNVNVILEKICTENNIKPEECTYWGDEYVGIEDGLFGSDSFMKTEKTKNGDFYDVSSLEGSRPENVEVLGGGVSTFVNFLIEQGKR